MAWNGHHLADMFRLGDLVILLHLVPTLPRVITHGVEEVGRIAPRPQVNDGAVLLEVDASPVPDRDVLARCKGTLTSNMYAPIFHEEETCIDSHDHISGIAPSEVCSSVTLLSVMRSTVSLGHSPNDRPTFYVEPIHPERHHLVECLGR